MRFQIACQCAIKRVEYECSGGAGCSIEELCILELQTFLVFQKTHEHNSFAYSIDVSYKCTDYVNLLHERRTNVVMVDLWDDRLLGNRER